MLAAASIGLFSARLPAAVCCSEQLCRILGGCGRRSGSSARRSERRACRSCAGCHSAAGSAARPSCSGAYPGNSPAAAAARALRSWQRSIARFTVSGCSFRYLRIYSRRYARKSSRSSAVRLSARLAVVFFVFMAFFPFCIKNAGCPAFRAARVGLLSAICTKRNAKQLSEN